MPKQDYLIAPSILAANFAIVGASGRIRTLNPLIRSQVLYPVELRMPVLEYF